MTPGRPVAAGMAATGCTVALLASVQFVEATGPLWLKAVAVALLLLAAIFISTPFVHLSRYGGVNRGESYFQTTRVVDRGLYRMVRHPQYLGYSLLNVGFAGLRPHPLLIGLAAGALVFFYAQSVVEERFCCERFGREYRAYMERVPRLNFLLGLFKMAMRRGAVPD